MRVSLVLLCAALLLASGLGFADEPCIECEELAGAAQARIFTLMHEENSTLEVIAFYENLSETPSRQPIRDSVIIIELTNSTDLKQLYKIYTDSEGKAYFDYSTWEQGCINFKALYCPFCVPAAPECGFLECLNFARIGTAANYYDNIPGTIEELDDVLDAPGATAPVPLSGSQYLPEIGTANYCPPPPPLTQTPALCLPLLIIFSLLAGSLYLTGRNPFAAFSLGRPRIGRHLRYQPRGRGYHISGMAILSAAATITRAAAVLSKEEKRDEKGKVTEKGGWDALAAEEKAAAKQRGGFFVAQVKRIGAAAKRGKQIAGIIAKGGKAEDIQREIESTSAAVMAAGAQAVTKEGPIMPGSASYSPRLSELLADGGKGLVVYLLTSSTLGSIVDSFYRSGRIIGGQSDKSIFETHFIDYDARKKAAEAVLDEMEDRGEIVREGGRIVSMQVAFGEEQYTVLSQSPGEEEDTTVISVDDTTGKSVDGKVDITLKQKKDKYGEVVGYEVVGQSYLAKGAVEATTENKEGIGRVKADIVSEMGAGKDASKFMESYTSGVENLKGISDTISEGIDREERKKVDAIRVKLEREDETGRVWVAEERKETAVEALKSGFELEPKPGAVSTTAYTLGVKPCSSKYGEMGAEESTVVAVHEAHRETLGAADFNKDIAAKSGLKEDSREMRNFNSAMGRVVSSTSAEKLAKMNPADFRKALSTEGIKEPGRINDDTFNFVRDTAAEFKEGLREQGCSDELIKRATTVTTSQVNKVASAGYQIKDENVATLLTNRLDDTSMSPELIMSPELRNDLREYEFLKSSKQYAAGMRGAVEGGDAGFYPASFGDHLDRYRERSEDLLTQSTINIAHREGHMDDKDYADINRGLDKHREAFKLESSLQTAMNPKVESRAREQIIDYDTAGDYSGAMALCAERVEAHEAAGNRKAANTYRRLMETFETARTHQELVETGRVKAAPKTDAQIKERREALDKTFMKSAGAPERLASQAIKRYSSAVESKKAGEEIFKKVGKRLEKKSLEREREAKKKA